MRSPLAVGTQGGARSSEQISTAMCRWKAGIASDGDRAPVNELITGQAALRPADLRTIGGPRRTTRMQRKVLEQTIRLFAGIVGCVALRGGTARPEKTKPSTRKASQQGEWDDDFNEIPCCTTDAGPRDAAGITRAYVRCLETSRGERTETAEHWEFLDTTHGTTSQLGPEIHRG